MRVLRYGIPFLALGSVPLGFMLGGAGSWLTVAATPLRRTRSGPPGGGSCRRGAAGR